jgi:hypothetical protein
MYHPFSVAETIKTAWNVLRKNFIPLLVYSIISLFVYELVDFFNLFIFVGGDRTSQFILIFLQMIVQAYLVLSFYKLILTLMDREFYEFEFKDIVPSVKMTFNFIIIALLYTLLIAILLLVNLLVERNFGSALIFKGVELLLLFFLMLRSIFCVCFIVDDDSKPFESLTQSFEITKDNFFKTLSIFAIIILIMVLALLPVIAFINIFGFDSEGAGYIFKLAFYCWFLLTFPFVQVLIMVTYRKLVYSHKDVDDDITETL